MVYYSRESFCGEPDESTDPALAIWMKAKNELHLRMPLPKDVWFALPNLLGEWVKTKNHSYIDLAIQVCDDNQFDYPEILKPEIAKAARARLRGQEFGTPNQIQRQARDNLIFTWVAYFMAADLTLAESAEKAASHFANCFSGVPAKKASTIEKEYPEKLKKSVVGGKNKEQHIREIYGTEPQLKIDVLALAKSIICPDELIGERR